MKASSLLALFLVLLVFSPDPGRADLVAHWKIDEGTGTTVADSTANARTGTVSALGATWTTTDLPPVPEGTSAALDMDGANGQVDIVGYKGVTGTQDRSVTAWIRTRLNDPNQNKGIVSWGQNVGTNKWTFRIQNGNGTAGAIRIEVNGGFFVGNTVVTDGEWHHVAVTWANDGTPDVIDAKLYVDGVLDAELGSLTVPPSASQSQTIATTATADVRIGDDFQGTHNWNGWIDDVRIYDEAIDAATVASLAIGTPISSNFAADAEIVASGTPVVLSWQADPTNDTLTIDNGIGDVSGLSMTTVNPTADTTYTLTGTRGAETLELQVTVLVEKAPVINDFSSTGSTDILEGAPAGLVWDVFGEASLDLAGTDVLGQSSIAVFPEATTTYTLTATNAWGTTTADITITVLPPAGPDLGWSAEGLPAGALAAWTPAINETGNAGIVFNSNTGGSVESGGTNFSGITQWVNSPGYNLFSNPNDSWQDGLGNPATMTNVTWEIVFRPGDFTGTHTLFNTGGNGDGTAFVLNGSTLEFRFQDAPDPSQQLFLSTDLTNIGTATEFYHVVGVADVNSAPEGRALLYVNGQLVAGPTTSTGVINDWDGGDLAELGKGGNIPGGNPFTFQAFTGDIALFNYYGGRLLNADRVSGLFDAVGGAGSGLVITGVVYNDTENRLEITWTSTPGRDYSVWESTDLQSWLEVDDAVPSGGTETTYFINGLDLPDPANARHYYQIRLPE